MGYFEEATKEEDSWSVRFSCSRWSLRGRMKKSLLWDVCNKGDLQSVFLWWCSDFEKSVKCLLFLVPKTLWLFIFYCLPKKIPGFLGEVGWFSLSASSCLSSGNQIRWYASASVYSLLIMSVFIKWPFFHSSFYSSACKTSLIFVDSCISF